jgi:hypothetical protein
MRGGTFSLNRGKPWFGETTRMTAFSTTYTCLVV